MEISADGSASIIGVRRTEVLIFNFQGSQKGFLFTLLLYRDWERHFVDPIVNSLHYIAEENGHFTHKRKNFVGVHKSPYCFLCFLMFSPTSNIL